MKRTFSQFGKLLIITIIGMVWLGSITINSGATTVPPKKKQVVYSMNLFNGMDFVPTFCPDSEDTIFILANAENIFSFRQTEVYYWPITEEYMADWASLNEEMPGTLEILEGKRVVKVLDKMKYTFVYPEGYWGNVNLVVGEEADKEYAAYNKQIEAYYNSIMEYYQKYAEWQNLVEEIASGKRQAKVPPEPGQPQPSPLYVIVPAQAYIMNLPVGEYTIRVKDEEGKLRPGSEKKLVVFTHFEKGIGYEIMPGEKYVVSTLCDNPQEIIYFTNKINLFFKVYETRLYNDYQYLKISKLESPFIGRGREYGKNWVELNERKGLVGQLLKDGKVIATIKEGPYYVNQIPGSALGYEIVEFEQEKFPNETPTFEAYKIEIDKPGRYEFRVVDEKGETLYLSAREITSVKSANIKFMYFLSLFPLVIGGIIFGWRRSLLPRGPRVD